MDKRIWILYGVVFVDLLGFGVIIPILPFLVQQYGGSPLIVGLLVSVYSFFQFIFAPILGRLSDKYGRRPVLFISSLLNASSYLLVFFSHDLWVLFISRALAGIGGSNISVAQAYVADVSKSHERTKLISMFGAFFGLGLIIGPFVGGYFAGNYSLNTPFLLTSIFSFVNSFLIILFVKESVHFSKQHIKVELFNYKVTREIMRPKNMGFLLILFFLVNFSLSLTQGVFPLFSNKIFSWQEEQVGYFFAFIGAISFIMQTFGISFLLERTTETALIRLGLVLFSIGFVFIGLANSVLFLMFGAFIFSLGLSLVNPSTQALISLESKEDEQGVVMGIAQSFASLARVLGPVIGGLIATYQINLPYIFSAILLALIFVWGRDSLKSYVKSNKV